MAQEISDAEFQKEVQDADVPVIVDFWAPWCGPCRALTPIMEEIAQEYNGKAKIVKVNTDDNPIEASKLRIAAIPTLAFFKNGKAVDQLVGVHPKSEIKKRIDALL